jgi:hypothetical protein
LKLLREGLFHEADRLFEAGLDPAALGLIDLGGQPGQIFRRFHIGIIPLQIEEAPQAGRIVALAVEPTEPSSGLVLQLVIEVFQAIHRLMKNFPVVLEAAIDAGDILPSDEADTGLRKGEGDLIPEAADLGADGGHGPVGRVPGVEEVFAGGEEPGLGPEGGGGLGLFLGG